MELAALRQELGPRQDGSFDRAGLDIERSELERHGVLGTARSRALRCAALERVVLPCTERMLRRADEQRAASASVALERQQGTSS